MPKVIIQPGTPQAQEFELKPGKNYVGRGFANDLKLEDGSVSGSHALLEMNGSVVTVTDLGSTNGTRINGLPATGSPLQSGQMLKLGTVELLYVAEATASPAKLAPEPPPPTAAAAQIATEFIIREPSRVGVAPPMPPPAGGELRIPGVSPAAVPPPPVPITTAPAPILQPSGLSNRTAPPSAPIAPPAVSFMAAAAAEAPLPAGGGLRLSNIAQPPPPTPVKAPALVPAAAQPQAAPPTAPAGLMKAPSGKTVCKFHKNTPGQWFCQKCDQLFCSLCVGSQPGPTGVGHFCRACGSQCVQVKIKAIAKKEKKLVAYSDGTVVLRTVGFGLGGAVAGAGIWIGFAALAGFDMPAIFAPVVGVLCGYAVKIASQDRPGGFFSAMAIGSMLLGVGMGMVGAILVIPHYTFTINSLVIAVFGLVLGVFLAWKVGGGDF